MVQKGFVRLLAPGFLLLAVLTGCSDPKAASKSNFEKTLNAYLSGEKARLCFTLKGDETIAIFEGSKIFEKGNYLVKRGGTTDSAFQALERHGLATKLDRKDKYFLPTNRYQLTEKAKQFQNGEDNQLCYAKNKLLEIKRYTEPAPQMGVMMSRVDVNLGYIDVAPWAKEPDIQKWLIRKKIDFDAVMELTIPFVLMDQGWEISQ